MNLHFDTQNKKCPAGTLGKRKIKPLYSNSSSSQRARILKHFEKNKTLSTMQARSELGILHPCGRILELRAQGFRIETHWINQVDDNGIYHRIGLYLFKGQGKEARQ